ncbi:general amino acid permease 1 [Stereum hirsutum FP-91666 SS1]|uniref:general amino acid permease 1 n=1 Tax=Stereum hirsutum (strain FP-91666) TaxID=721885 RepID=UPI000444A5FB|nr:general amino acid permease 1 [Stereum hirsutum FP-91666 SS1]EIM81765.1 general amino acid permease 1 [Stereum hirsutum FP-91666 SS1]
MLSTRKSQDSSSQKSRVDETVVPLDSRQGVEFYRADLDKVQRRLDGRHIQMFAIASVVGTGLFLGLGSTLSYTGPLGLLLVFLHVGTVAFCSLASISEMTAFAPVSGTFSHFAARWVDPALGFAVGWNYFYTCAIALPAEITAAAAVIEFWDSNPNHTAIYIAVFIVLAFVVNLLGARTFGNTEIVFSALKLALVAILVIGGLVIDLGGGPDGQRHGFEYWRNPGPMVSSLASGARGRFIGLLLAITPAAFAMCGMEIVTVAAAETRNPRKNIIIAMKTVFFRIFFCYILTALLVGMLIPSNDPDLFTAHAGAGESPFVLAFNRAGVKVLPHFINAIVMTSAFSSGNGMLYSSSRLLYSLAVQGQAPKFFTRVTSSGVPIYAILAAGSFAFLAFLNIQTEAGIVFNWFVSIVTVGGLLNWLMIGVTYLRYYYGLRAQGINRKIDGIYRSRLQPYAAMWVIFWAIFFILVSGISVFFSWNTSNFVAAYVNLPIYAVLYCGWKIYKKTKILPLAELDFVTDIPSIAQTEDAGFVEKMSGARKLKEFL